MLAHVRKGVPALGFGLLVALGAACSGSGGPDPCPSCGGDVPFDGTAQGVPGGDTGLSPTDGVQGDPAAAGTGAGTDVGTGSTGTERPPTATPPDDGSSMVPPAADQGLAGMGAEMPAPTGGCGQTLPPVTDYGANGPFATTTINGTGPDGQYTMVRPTTLGDGGFLHPIATWGNGITTTPANYPGLLGAIASHGFVIIASNSSNVTAQLMTDGLDWLIAQNDAAGDLQGKLDTDCAVTIGYSLGGGASVGSGAHPAVVATVSWHGLQGPAENLHAPLFLMTSTNDGFVTKSGYVQPCYDRSSVVPTVMATLEVPGAAADFFGHLIPMGDAGDERAPGIAWLRMWVYGDADAEAWFYGSDCKLCGSPWTDIQRKNASW